MPIADMTGAAANRIGVANRDAAAGQQRRAQIVGGISGVAEAAGDAMHRQTVQKALVASGYSPEEASALSRDPHAAVSALIEKKREKEQRDQQLADKGTARTQQVTDLGSSYARQDAAQGFTGGKMDPSGAYTPGAYSAGADPALAEAREKGTIPTYSDTQQDEMTKYQRGEVEKQRKALAAAHAPVPGFDMKPPTSPFMPVQPNMVEGTPTSEDPDAKTIALRMGRSGYKYDAPGEMTPRNTDPLSPEGVKAQKEINASKGTAPRTITQAMIDSFGLPQGALGQPSTDWVRMNEGEKNRTAAGERSKAGIDQRIAEAKGRMSDQDKQQIDALQSQMANTWEDAAMETLVKKIDAIIERSRAGAATPASPGGTGHLPGAALLKDGGAQPPAADVPLPADASAPAKAAWPKWTPEQRKAYLAEKARLAGQPR